MSRPVSPVRALALAMAAALLAWASAADARPIFTEFNYPFDSGGELHNFITNNPDDGGKVEWKAGGALGSIGCLKVTGSTATTDSEFKWFKAGESTISFHYYLHGYSRLRLRMNVAQAEDVARYGRYGHYFVPNVVQDKWVFVQIKPTDIPGDAKDKPKGYPELLYKTLTFIADEGGGEGAYLLLDNIRLGPPIEEKDIQIRTRERKTVGAGKTTLLDFEDPAQAKLVRSVEGDDVKLSIAEAGASSGKQSLKLVCKAGKPWTAFDFDPSLLKGWEKYDYLAFDLYTEDPHFVRLTAEFWDAATRGYPTRSTYGEMPGTQIPLMHKGKNHIQMDLRLARRNNKEGLSFSELRAEDKIDMAHLVKVKAWFSTEDLKDDYVVYLDNVRLLQEGALETNMKVDLPKGAIAFDFGDNSPLVEGFTEANLADIWAEDKPFGFVNPEGLRTYGRGWPDPLTGDFVGPAFDEEGNPRSASFEFRAKAPNGRYLVWLSAEYFPFPNLYTDLAVNGKLLWSGEMTGEAFYTERWLFRFLDTPYSEKPNALWKNAVARMYPAPVVEAEVKDGTLVVKGANTYLGALILVPADRKGEFDKLAAQIEAERTRYFYKDLYLVRPENEPCRVKDEALVLFAPADGKTVLPWTGIDAKDAQELRKVASPGEAVAMQVALRPFRDLAAAKLGVSDLRGPGGAAIPAKQIEIYQKRYISDGAQVNSWCLRPADSVDLEQNLTVAFWLRAKVPSDAPAGVYRGTVTAAAGSARKELPLEIQVFPVHLRDDVPLAIGYYYAPPDEGQWALFNQMKDFQAGRDRLLKEQMELLKEFGMTSVSLPCPEVTALRGSGVSLGFASLEKVAKAAKAAGLLANPSQPGLVPTLSLGRSIGGKLSGGKPVGIGEELRLPGFDSAYVSANMQLVEWAERVGVPIVNWVVDEPRESPNPWNRNYADTVAYLKLAGQVKGNIRMITPMGDSSASKDYLPMLDEMEIVATHAGKGSARMIERAMTTHKPALWIYNTGKDRYSNGFYLWRVGAGGKHEWHFCMWVGETFAGKYPGRDVHNPVLNYELTGATVPAPLKYKGALLPMEGLMTMAAGATDWRYLATLEQAIADAKKSGGAKAAEAAEAEKFLAALKNVIPVLPEVKKLASEKDLALVGEGIVIGGGLDLEASKRKVAEWIVKLQGEDKK